MNCLSETETLETLATCSWFCTAEKGKSEEMMLYVLEPEPEFAVMYRMPSGSFTAVGA